MLNDCWKYADDLKLVGADKQTSVNKLKETSQITKINKV